MDHCVPICAGVVGTCLDGVLYSLSSTRRAFAPYICCQPSSSRQGYSSISQDEQAGLLDEPDSEDEEDMQRRQLERQERGWDRQGQSSKAGKVLGINNKARQILGLGQSAKQPQAKDDMHVGGPRDSTVFDADDA